MYYLASLEHFVARYVHPLGQVALSAGLTFCALMAAELLMLATNWPDPGLYTGDRAWLWHLRPDLERSVTDPVTERTFVVETNSLGFRGKAPPLDGAWTLTMGCSTTFGWGVEALEAWPARLESLLEQPVVNGGVPGWSTAQAVRALPELVGNLRAHLPSQVILAFGVRDAQMATQADSAARRTPWLLRTRWALLLGATQGKWGALERVEATHRRVAPDQLAVNLDRLVTGWESAGAEVHVLLFPQAGTWPPPGYAAAARRGAGEAMLESVDLPAGAFFPEDPVHLTPAGHMRFARAVAHRIGAGPAPASTHITE